MSPLHIANNGSLSGLLPGLPLPPSKTGATNHLGIHLSSSTSEIGTVLLPRESVGHIPRGCEFEQELISTLFTFQGAVSISLRGRVPTPYTPAPTFADSLPWVEGWEGGEPSEGAFENIVKAGCPLETVILSTCSSPLPHHCLASENRIHFQDRLTNDDLRVKDSEE